MSWLDEVSVSHLSDLPKTAACRLKFIIRACWCFVNYRFVNGALVFDERHVERNFHAS